MRMRNLGWLIKMAEKKNELGNGLNQIWSGPNVDEISDIGEKFIQFKTHSRISVYEISFFFGNICFK